MIYLVRHGQTDWNILKKLQGQRDEILNDNGRMQAENIAKEIEKLGITKIYTSDLKRAVETAEIINKNIGAEIIPDKRLREIDYGDFEGRVVYDITEEEWKIFNSSPDKLHAESNEEVFQRIKSFFNELDDKNESILIVTHGGSLRMIRYYMQNSDNFNFEDFKYFIENIKTKNAELVEFNRN